MRSSQLWISSFLAACLMTLAPSAGRSAEPAANGGSDTKAIDMLVNTTLRDVINKGREMYNPPNSDYAGCWHLYEGALISIRPFLAHRPGLQDSITKGLAAAYNESSIGDRAFVLRKVMDDIRLAVKGGAAVANTPPAAAPATTPATGTATTKTLWERLGGEDNVRKVVDDLVRAAAEDPKVNFFRNGKYITDLAGLNTLKRRLVEYVSAATHGPLQYTGKDMKTAHAGMGITEAEFKALAGHLKTALEKNGAQPADVTAVLTAVGATAKDIVEKKSAAAAEKTPPMPLEPGTPKLAQRTTLWERLGGEKNVARVVDDLFATAGMDPAVNFFRDPTLKLPPSEVANLKKKVIDLISSVSEGPFKYSGKSMKEAHKGMNITNAQFDAFAGHLKKALEKNHAAAADITAVINVVEGTRKDIVAPTTPEK